MGDDYDDEIVHGMNYRHWLQIKRVKNICNNNTETNKGQYGYNPRYKFYNKWHCLIHNVNFLTTRVTLDIYWDETSWATASYGDTGDGLTGRIFNKPGIMNIVQTVLDRDVHCISMRAYRNRQNFHVKPPGWNL